MLCAREGRVRDELLDHLLNLEGRTRAALGLEGAPATGWASLERSLGLQPEQVGLRRPDQVAAVLIGFAGGLVDQRAALEASPGPRCAPLLGRPARTVRRLLDQPEELVPLALELLAPAWHLLGAIERDEVLPTLRAVCPRLPRCLSRPAVIAALLHVYRYLDRGWLTERVPLRGAHLDLSTDARFGWMARNATLVASSESLPVRWQARAIVAFYTDARTVQRLLEAHEGALDAQTDDLRALATRQPPT